MPISDFTPPTRTLGSLGPLKANHPSLPYVDNVHQYSAGEYNETNTWILRYYDAILGLEGSGSALIWRPDEPSPSNNVFENWEDLAEALAEREGSVTIFLDDSLTGSFDIPAGAYPMVCSELRFESVYRPTVNFLTGVTFTGGTIRSLVIDNVTIEWRGSAGSLLGLITSEFLIDMHRFARLTSAEANTREMFEIDEVCHVQMHGPQCQLDATSGYEIFKISDTCGVNIFPDMFCGLLGNYARSSGTGADDGGVSVLYDSNLGVTIEPAQANLGGDYTIVDSSQFGATQALLDALTSLVATIEADVTVLNGIATTAVSSTTGTTFSWLAQERVRLANTGTTHCAVTLNADVTEWPIGRQRPLSQYGSTTGGFTILVPSGHKLNTITDGTSGVIGAAAADDSLALFTIMVTREASDEWSWA